MNRNRGDYKKKKRERANEGKKKISGYKGLKKTIENDDSQKKKTQTRLNRKWQKKKKEGKRLKEVV